MWGVRNWRGVVLATRETKREAEKAAARLVLESWEYTIEEVGTVEHLERQRRRERAADKKARRALQISNFAFPSSEELKKKK